MVECVVQVAQAAASNCKGNLARVIKQSMSSAGGLEEFEFLTRSIVTVGLAKQNLGIQVPAWAVQAPEDPHP